MKGTRHNGRSGKDADFDGIKPDTEIKDASEMYRLYDAFKEAGLSVEQCEKLFWKNADRLLKEIL